MIRLRLFPIPPDGQRKVRLTYAELLEFGAGTVRYAYPFSPQRFSPSPVKQIVLTAEIRSPKGVGNVYSPSHAVDIVRQSDRRVKVGFEKTNAKLKRH